MGVDLFLGHAEFTGKNTVSVNGKTLNFKKACIATGGRPYIPEIEGLKDVKFCTSDNIFNLTELPKSMLIVGSGPIGCELGQGFARLGTEVTMLERGNHFLPREDADCAVYVQEQMKQDGVNFLFMTKPTKFEQVGDVIRVTYESNDTTSVTKDFDQVLIATGRVPNVENLGLANAGVESEKAGVTVNEYL